VCVEVHFVIRIHAPHNRFQKKIEGLDALVNLEELWLGKNKITKLEVWSSIPPVTTRFLNVVS